MRGRNGTKPGRKPSSSGRSSNDGKKKTGRAAGSMIRALKRTSVIPDCNSNGKSEQQAQAAVQKEQQAEMQHRQAVTARADTENDVRQQANENGSSIIIRP